MVSGSPGRNSRSVAPVRSETKRTRSQLCPPLRVRYTPRSGFGANGFADRRHPGGVGVGGMDEDGARIAGVFEADALPGRAGVVGAIHALSHDDIAAQAVGAGGHIDDVRVALGDRDRADRGAAEITVGDRPPVVAVVGGLPDPAAGRTHVEGARVGAVARHRGDPAAPGGADHPVTHRRHQIGIGLGGQRDRRQQRSEQGPEQRRRRGGQKRDGLPAHRTSLHRFRTGCTTGKGPVAWPRLPAGGGRFYRGRRGTDRLPLPRVRGAPAGRPPSRAPAGRPPPRTPAGRPRSRTAPDPPARPRGAAAGTRRDPGRGVREAGRDRGAGGAADRGRGRVRPVRSGRGAATAPARGMRSPPAALPLEGPAGPERRAPGRRGRAPAGRWWNNAKGRPADPGGNRHSGSHSGRSGAREKRATPREARSRMSCCPRCQPIRKSNWSSSRSATVTASIGRGAGSRGAWAAAGPATPTDPARTKPGSHQTRITATQAIPMP